MWQSKGRENFENVRRSLLEMRPEGGGGDVKAGQTRALNRAPTDGSWITSERRLSVASTMPDLIEEQRGPYGEFRRARWRYRLTPAGRALKMERKRK